MNPLKLVRICTAYYTNGYGPAQAMFDKLGRYKDYRFIFEPRFGSDLASVRNSFISDFSNEVLPFSFFYIWDGDQDAEPEVLYTLLDHLENKHHIDIIGAPVKSRADETKYCCWKLRDNCQGEYMYPVSEKGLKNIDLLNDGCMLIRRSVFQRVFSESKTLAFWRSQLYKDDSGIEQLATLDRGFRNLMKSHGFDFWCDFDLGSKVYHKFKTEKENKMDTKTNSQVPDNIDQIALEANEIWAAIANNYRRLANTNKILVENNQALTNKIVGLKNQIKVLIEKLEASEKPQEKKDPPAPAK